MTKILNQKLLTPSQESPDHVVFRKTNLVVPPVQDKEDDQRCLGRQILYEPMLVMTPVLASQRIQNQDDTKKRLITAADVDALTAQLDTMLSMGGSNETKDEEKEEPELVASSKETEQDKPTAFRSWLAMMKRSVLGDNTKTATPAPFDKDTTTTWGRYDDTVFSTKANGDVSVKRSSRFHVW